MSFRRTFVSLFAALAAAFAHADSKSPAPRPDSTFAAAPADFLNPDQLRAAGLAKFWQLQLPLDRTESLSSIYLVDDALYGATSGGYVYALDAYTGVIRWLRPVSAGEYPVTRPCHAADRVVFVTPSQMILADRISGDGRLRSDLGFAAGSEPVSDDLRVYVGSVNHRFYALGVSNGFEHWKAGTQGRITSRPILIGEHLIVASHDAGVYSAFASTKQLHWQRYTSGPNSADLVADERGVFVASEDHSLYLLDSASGQVVWRTRFSGPLTEPPVLAPERAFQYCPDDGLACVDTNPLEVTHRVTWKMRDGRTLLTADKSTAYILTTHQNIVAANLVDGKVTQIIAAPGFVLSDSAVADGALYVAAPDGRIFCARARSVPFLKREDLRVALATGGRKKPTEDASDDDRPTSRPAPRADEDYLETHQARLLVGGKSKVTKAMEEGAAPRANPARPANPKPAELPEGDKP